MSEVLGGLIGAGITALAGVAGAWIKGRSDQRAQEAAADDQLITQWRSYAERMAADVAEVRAQLAAQSEIHTRMVADLRRDHDQALSALRVQLSTLGTALQVATDYIATLRSGHPRPDPIPPALQPYMWTGNNPPAPRRPRH